MAQSVWLRFRLFLFKILSRIVNLFPLETRRKNPLYIGLRGLIYPLLKPRRVFQVQAKDFTLYVSGADQIIASELIVDREYEKNIARVIKANVKPGMMAADIGANIGYFTVMASKQAGPGGAVIAFEPDPENFEILNKNIQLNACANVFSVRAAVSSQEGSAMLFKDQKNFGAHSLAQTNLFTQASEGADCRVRSLDVFFQERGSFKLDFIKMDIQGSEGHALEGAQRLLRENPDLKILLEFWPAGLRNLQTDPARLLEELFGKGFKAFKVEETLKPAGKQELLEEAERLGYINILFSRT